MQKKFFAVATFALAFAVAFSASAYDLGSTTLKKGSKGAAVVELQKALNACNAAGISTDGSFGRGTESAVKAFQASKNLSADGKVGAISKAALNSCTTSSSTSTSTGTSSNWSNSSAEGYLATIEADSANKVSTVYESEQDKVVAGFRGTAKLADQKIEKVTVKFHQTATSASANLGKYISSVSLWNGSSKIATMSVADADRSTSDDTYTFNFTGLNPVIAKDAVGRFYVSVNVNGALDSNDTTYSKFYINISDVRSTSPNGVYNNYTPSGLAIGTDYNPSAGLNTPNLGGLTFAKYSASGVKATVSLATSSPIAYTQEVSKTAVTNGVKLLDFNVKAEVSSVTLRNLPITISSSAVPSSFINTVKLMKGSDVVGDFAPSTGSTYTLTNLASQYASVAAGTTATYSIVADLKAQGATYGNYANGTTVSAKITSVAAGSWSVIDSNGDQLVTRSGGAQGYLVTLASAGASVTVASEAYTAPVTGTSTADGIISLTLNVTAFGGDVTINEDGSDITATLSNATTTDTLVTSTTLTAQSGVFTIPEGQTQKITLSKKFNSVTGFVILSVSAVDGANVSNIKTMAH